MEKVVAVVHDLDNSVLVYDQAYNWESAQSYAQQGYSVSVLEDDGHMTRADIQSLCDYENRLFEDCFG